MGTHNGTRGEQLRTAGPYEAGHRGSLWTRRHPEAVSELRFDAGRRGRQAHGRDRQIDRRRNRPGGEIRRAGGGVINQCRRLIPGGSPAGVQPYSGAGGHSIGE